MFGLPTFMKFSIINRKFIATVGTLAVSIYNSLVILTKYQHHEVSEPQEVGKYISFSTEAGMPGF